jgi:uncharacterized protein (TIGR03067 family)
MEGKPMRRTVCLLAVVLLALPSLGSDAPKDYDGATAVADEELRGTWVLKKVERNGHLLMARRGDQTFRGRVWEEKRGSDRRIGTYTADPSRNPCFLDIVHPDDPPGTTRKYIYQVHGDTLKMAFIWEPGERPASFQDFEDKAGLTVATYKRVKK